MTDYRDILVERLIEGMERMQVRMRSRPPAAPWSDMELTMPQARTLFFLGHGPKRMGDISAHLGRGMPSATSMVMRGSRVWTSGLVSVMMPVVISATRGKPQSIATLTRGPVDAMLVIVPEKVFLALVEA